MIINTSDQLKAAGGGVAIVVSHGGIRDTYVQGWAIYRIGPDGKPMETDPKAPYYEHGLKVFRLSLDAKQSFQQRRMAALVTAQAWVAEQGWYDGAWKRNRIGDFVPVAIALQFPLAPRRKQVSA